MCLREIVAQEHTTQQQAEADHHKEGQKSRLSRNATEARGVQLHLVCIVILATETKLSPSDILV